MRKALREILDSEERQLQEARDRFMTIPRMHVGDEDTEAIERLFDRVGSIHGILRALIEADG